MKNPPLPTLHSLAGALSRLQDRLARDHEALERVASPALPVAGEADRIVQSLAHAHPLGALAVYFGAAAPPQPEVTDAAALRERPAQRQARASEAAAALAAPARAVSPPPRAQRPTIAPPAPAPEAIAARTASAPRPDHRLVVAPRWRDAPASASRLLRTPTSASSGAPAQQTWPAAPRSEQGAAPVALPGRAQGSSPASLGVRATESTRGPSLGTPSEPQPGSATPAFAALAAPGRSAATPLPSIAPNPPPAPTPRGVELLAASSPALPAQAGAAQGDFSALRGLRRLAALANLAEPSPTGAPAASVPMPPPSPAPLPLELAPEARSPAAGSWLSGNATPTAPSAEAPWASAGDFAGASHWASAEQDDALRLRLERILAAEARLAGVDLEEGVP
jgi:hypothetical protein